MARPQGARVSEGLISQGVPVGRQNSDIGPKHIARMVPSKWAAVAFSDGFDPQSPLAEFVDIARPSQSSCA